MAKLESRLLIKSIGIEINSTYDSLRDKIIDYLELIKEFDRKKHFIAIKLRSYIDDTEIVKFIDTVLNHSYNLIMIEGYEQSWLPNEQRYIIDADLCEIY